MTRKRWTTDSQEEWLKARIEGFIKAYHDKTLSKEFLPVVIKEFRDLWPVPPLTTEEAADTTVESQWKEDFNQAWGDYLATWNTENPDVKPGKTCLVYLMEFMKGKLAAETDEMKAKVEEYRLSEKEESPAPFDSNHEKNLEIQL
jgi:hypothetical protein